MTARAFPTAPSVWSDSAGMLTPEARRFLHSMFSQLGGVDPVDLAALQASVKELEQMMILVAALP